jgi:hypothetical protein
VALKIAVFPNDPRFMREVELLARIHHPAVPQLLDQGSWHASAETSHPHVVMEWSRGKPLYEWARVHNPTCRQVLRVVAQVAWGLEVVHRSDCLHRDVKGDNILVEPEGRAVLTDFGSGTWKGAPPLTERVMPPNTPEYRSPEALRFEWGNWDKKGARYPSSPADDLYALGAALYRLLTRVYPPPGTEPEVLKEQSQESSPRRLPAHELNGRVVRALSALVERLLSKEPEARGTAREVAEAAEAAAEHLGPEADVPVFGPELPTAEARAVATGARPVPGADPAAVEAVVEASVHGRAEPQARSWAWRPVLTIAAMSLTVVGPCWMAPEWSLGPPESAREEEPDAGMAPDAGTRGLGDDALTTRMEAQEIHLAAESISLDIPKQPLSGQRRPPCRRSWGVVINGGCWKLLAGSEPPCDDGEYRWQGACYVPALDQSRPPTTQKPQ